MKAKRYNAYPAHKAGYTRENELNLISTLED